jgi:Tfp pilus assembly protein PilF
MRRLLAGDREGDPMFDRRRWRDVIASLTLMCTAIGWIACATPSADEEARIRARRAVSHLNLGIGHLQSGRSALALREFLTAESLDARNPRIQYALGEAYMAREKLEDAELHFLKALNIHPEFHDAQLSLSALLIVLERYEEAADLCQGLVDEPTFPEPWAALANRGWAEFKLGRRAEGRRSLELAQEYRPNYWPAMLSLAVLESEEGRRMQAISLLQEVIELGPGPGVEAEANYRLAENYIALGKRDRAVGHLTTAVARAPDGEWARRSEAYLKLLR